MKSVKLVNFSDVDTPVEEYYLDKHKLLEGNPKQSLWNHYTDESDKFFSGVWQSEMGKWKISYTEEEFCQILEGVSIVSDDQGVATTLRVGDSFVIPKGFNGTWEVVEPTRKLYAIYEES
jgi:uncharacterized cupin superfamily protein